MNQNDNGAWLGLTVTPAPDPESIPTVSLYGDRAGLEWLAEQILWLAQSAPALGPEPAKFAYWTLDKHASSLDFDASGWELKFLRIDEKRGERSST